MNPSHALPHDAPDRDVVSGLVITICALLTVLAMSHHPEGMGHGSGAVSLNRIVHGGLILVLTVMCSGMLGLAQSLGLRRALVRLGLVSFLLGSLAWILAGAVNGFILGALMERYASAEPETLEALDVALAWGWEFNQALALGGVMAMCLATLSWSLHLLRCPRWWRLIGLVGLALGVVFAALFLGGRLDTDVHGFGLFVFAHSGWNAAAGIALTCQPRGESG